MNITAPKPGYWRSNSTSEIFTPCLRTESCLGGNETDAIGQCETGYKGILCADCQTGYSKVGLNCTLCPEVGMNIVIFICLMIAVIGVVVLMVKSTLGGLTAKKPLYSVLLKIFMNHF